MQRRLTLRLVATVLVTTGLCACGASGGKKPEAEPGLQEQLSALERMQAPQGVKEPDWQLLKSALAESLTQRFSQGRVTAAAPQTDASKTSLSFDSVNLVLSWPYYSQGDYDQNGEVNISDLTPIAQHFGESSGGGPFAASTVQSVIDGDNNGEINIADISPIGVNFGCRVGSYRVHMSTSASDYPSDNAAADSASILGVVPLSSAQGDAASARKTLNYTILAPLGLNGDEIYWVRPNDSADGSGQDGTASTPAGPAAPIQSSIQVYQLGFEVDDGPTVDNSDWGQVDVTFMGRSERLYFNMDFNGAPVLTNIPLISPDGEGVEHTITLPFSLGIASGTPLSEANISYTLEASPKAASSSRHTSGTINTVINRKKFFKNGQQVPAPSFNELGRDLGLDTDLLEPVYHKNFPNIEVGINEQTAAAVSMSLTYLRDRWGLELGPEFAKPIDIPAMRQACFELFDGPGGKYIGTALNWPTYKDEYMKAHNYPIITRETRDLREAIKALGDGCDVELITKPQAPFQQEVFALQGMQLMAGGGCWVQYAEDLEPGLPGGRTFQMAYLGVDTLGNAGYDQPGLLGYWGEDECDFVIECPPDETEWKGLELYKGGGRLCMAEGRPDGSMLVCFDDLFGGVVRTGLVSPLQLAGPATVMNPAPTDNVTKLLSFCTNGDNFWCCYEEGLVDHALYCCPGSVSGETVSAGSEVLLDFDDVLIHDSASLMYFQNALGVAGFRSSDLLTTLSNNPAGTSFDPLQGIQSSFGKDPCLATNSDKDVSLLAWNYSGVVRILFNYNFSTQMGAGTIDLGSNVTNYRLKWIPSFDAFVLLYETSDDKVFVSFSADGSNWSTPDQVPTFLSGFSQFDYCDDGSGGIYWCGICAAADVLGIYYQQITNIDGPDLSLPTFVCPQTEDTFAGDNLHIIYNPYLEKVVIVGPGDSNSFNVKAYVEPDLTLQ